MDFLRDGLKEVSSDGGVCASFVMAVFRTAVP